MPQSASQLNTERDLIDAKALLQDAQLKEDGQKYRKAAEIILQKILFRDPNNDEVKALLQAAQAARTSAATPTAPLESAQVPAAPAPLKEPIPFKKPSQPANVTAFKVVQPSIAEKTPQSSGAKIVSRIPLVLVAGVVLAVGIFAFAGYGRGPKPSATPQPSADLLRVSNETTSDPAASLPATASEPAKKVETEKTEKKEAPAVASFDLKTAAASTAAAPVAAVTAAPEVGNLAVSSPVAADAYLGDKYLGSTPGTFQIPAGKQTVEFRHGDLRSTATYDIKAKETVAARVAFEISVQVNARPWAQVYLDGAPRRPLGQTPLGSVRVPIGSVLVFENPNFPSKSHRITDKDSSIQVAFP